MLLDATLRYVPLGHCMAMSVGIIFIACGDKTISDALYKSNPTELKLPFVGSFASFLSNCTCKYGYTFMFPLESSFAYPKFCIATAAGGTF